jgi:hypothetical protein
MRLAYLPLVLLFLAAPAAAQVQPSVPVPSRAYVDTQLGTKLPAAGGSLTGPVRCTVTTCAAWPINWAGANPLAAIAYDLTATSDTAQEAGAIFRMTSAKGAASGTGALSAFKIPLGTEMTMLPGAGNSYSFNSVITASSGVGNFQVSNQELNTNINNQDYPPTIGQPFATSLLLQGISNYRQTALLFANNAGYALGSTPAGKYLSYEGLWFYGPYTISDHTIRDDTNAAVSYSIGGSHSGSAISDSSTTPASLAVTGSKSLADISLAATSPIAVRIVGTKSSSSISDAATTPAAVNLSGTYSLAAIYTANSSASVALATKDTQRVCLKGTDACLYHSGTTLRLAVGGTDVASISDGGAGTFTSLTSTGLTKLGVYTYAQLPTCNAANQYTYATVTDAVSTTFNQIINQGGSNNQVLAYCNGGGWLQR